MALAFPNLGSGTVVPVYLPSGGLSATPYATLLGRPVVPSEVAQQLGYEGDLILVDFSQYLTVAKAGGLRSDISIHLWFDYDVTAFRFIMRLGGQCWWTSPIKRAHGTNTLSCCVTLADRHA
jgi:HK97 family phage major capsid protein